MNASRRTNRALSTRMGRGFTLIEVLVVVAIIALLIAILLPSLAAARRQARITVCATNLHTIGMGTEYYIQANRGDMPAGYETNDDGTVKLTNGLPEISGNPWEFLYPYVMKAGAKKGQNTWSGSGWRLDIPVFACPDDIKQHTTDQRPIQTSDGLKRVEIGLSYMANNKLLWKKSDDRTAGTWKRDAIKRQSSIVVYNDGGDDEADGGGGWILLDCMASMYPSNVCPLELRHKTGNNFAFLDGHVEFYKMTYKPPQYGLPPYPFAWLPNYTSPGSKDNWVRAAPMTRSPGEPATTTH